MHEKASRSEARVGEEANKQHSSMFLLLFVPSDSCLSSYLNSLSDELLPTGVRQINSFLPILPLVIVFNTATENKLK